MVEIGAEQPPRESVQEMVPTGENPGFEAVDPDDQPSQEMLPLQFSVGQSRIIDDAPARPRSTVVPKYQQEPEVSIDDLPDDIQEFVSANVPEKYKLIIRLVETGGTKIAMAEYLSKTPTLTEVAERLGCGNYDFQWTFPKPGTKKGTCLSRRVFVGGPMFEELHENYSQAKRKSYNQPPPSAPIEQKYDGMFKMQENMFSKALDMAANSVQRFQPPAAPQQDSTMAVVLTGMLNMMAESQKSTNQLFLALLTNNKPAQLPMPDADDQFEKVLTRMERMKSFTSPAAPPSAVDRLFNLLESSLPVVASVLTAPKAVAAPIVKAQRDSLRKDKDLSNDIDAIERDPALRKQFYERVKAKIGEDRADTLLWAWFDGTMPSDELPEVDNEGAEGAEDAEVVQP